MPRRKELKGVAAELCERFMSRNNDANGYWAPGLLYKAAVEDYSNKLTFNIFAGESSPYFEYAKELSVPLIKLIMHQLKVRGFHEYQIVKAVVELQFDIDPTAHQILCKNTWGSAFSCRVVLTDDLSVHRVYEKFGWCGQHNPKREHQSTRVFAL